MKGLLYALMGLAAVMAFAATAPPAGAQTAYDINRLNAAIQLCNSGFAATPECQKLRGQLGGVGIPRAGGVPGVGGGGTAGALAGLLGGVMAPTPAPAPVAAPTVGIDLNRAITACVARAAGVQAEIDRCLAIAGGGVRR